MVLHIFSLNCQDDLNQLACLQKKSDVVYSNHRCHAHYIAKGGNINKMIAEIHGRKNGCVGGVGGSMHLQDLSVNLMASIPIVSSAIGLSLGAALNQKRNKSKLFMNKSFTLISTFSRL